VRGHLSYLHRLVAPGLLSAEWPVPTSPRSRFPTTAEAAASLTRTVLTMAAAEPVSPELALVAEDLRAAAIAALPDVPSSLDARRRTDEAPDAAPATPTSRERSVVAGALWYAAWHALLGAILVVGAVAAVILGLLVLGAVT
jgi:hypothetical protein